ncbi:MAG: hypothetical protein IH793_03710 [Acidobacteria bacterium]|nr:hypothetical protein [Acidobacteriota bacterium]
MPANLTPEYLKAEQRFKEARTSAEKIVALEEMLTAIPKHKGTEKMQAELKRRLKKLRPTLPPRKPRLKKQWPKSLLPQLTRQLRKSLQQPTATVKTPTARYGLTCLMLQLPVVVSIDDQTLLES